MYKTPRQLLQEYNLHPKKEWGQNFLTSGDMCDRIVRSLGVQKGDRVLELGAGTGALTYRLCDLADHVFALERDRDLVALLEKEIQAPNVTVIAADAARFDLATLPGDGPLRVIGNLPYNISSPILFQLLKQRHLFTRLIVMLQKEVADRLLAQPRDGKDYSILSIRFAPFFSIRKMIAVPRTSFLPRPHVDSTVVCLDTLPSPRIPVADEIWYARVVKAAFANRRKILQNSLSAAFPAIPRDTLPALLTNLGLQASVRGETLTIEEFSRLSEAIKTAFLSVSSGPLPDPDEDNLPPEDTTSDDRLRGKSDDEIPTSEE